MKKALIDNGIGGLEFICSVPGKIGGLLRTNAGCFKKNVSDVFVRAHIMNDWGEIYEVEADDFNFSYRSSMFPDNWIILDVTLHGVKTAPEEIKKTLEEQLEYRKAHQPINKKTAGSTFKNPEGLAAWKLIDEAGCRGLKVGDAEVSDMHCNFLINKGNATAEDIEKLGEMIVEQVKEKTAITLEWEVRRMGVKK
jgi:UDP-N-acetylmuramate dehydrogenase